MLGIRRFSSGRLGLQKKEFLEMKRVKWGNFMKDFLILWRLVIFIARFD